MKCANETNYHLNRLALCES